MGLGPTRRHLQDTKGRGLGLLNILVMRDAKSDLQTRKRLIPTFRQRFAGCAKMM